MKMYNCPVHSLPPDDKRIYKYQIIELTVINKIFNGHYDKQGMYAFTVPLIDKENDLTAVQLCAVGH